MQSATSGILLENSDSKLFSGIHDKSSFGFPASWEITTIEPFLSTTRPGMKTGPFGSLLKKSEYQSEGVPVVGIENIGAFDFVYGSKNYISEFKAGELDSYDLQPNDLIISRSGTVGEIAVIPHNIGEARFSTNIMRLVLDTSKIKPRYFQFLFKGCSFVLDQVGELCKGSTRDFINQKILKALIYPIPPLAEQVEILRRVEHLFAFADRLEERCIEAKKQVDKLTAAILAKAFRGELVPQDPNDEPAEKLLERIRKAKDLEKAKAKKRVKKLND